MNNSVNAINATAATPRNMQIMKIICSIGVLRRNPRHYCATAQPEIVVVTYASPIFRQPGRIKT
jgi:hypothetical protein